MTAEGMGPWQIAKRLTEKKVEKPSYYQATRQRGNFKTMCDFETPYNWTGGSVARILERPEYMVSDGELRETQTANYFSNLYPIDCAVPSVNA